MSGFLYCGDVEHQLYRRAAAMPTAIEFRDVSLTLRDGRTLLDRIHLKLEQGTITALLGRSGCGKTTLLRTVNRMTVPTAGAVLVDGKDNAQANIIRLRRGM